MGRRGETNKQKPVAGVLFHHRDSQNDSCETRVSQSSERVETDPDKKQTNTTWSTRLQKQRGVKEQTSLCLVVEIRELTPADWKIWTSVSQPRQSRLLRHRSAAAELRLWLQRAHYSHASGCCFNLFCHFYNKTLGEGVLYLTAEFLLFLCGREKATQRSPRTTESFTCAAECSCC